VRVKRDSKKEEYTVYKEKATKILHDSTMALTNVVKIFLPKKLVSS
jgi:hypothetical protein